MNSDLVTDAVSSGLWSQLQHTYASAFTASTAANHVRQAKSYLTFMLNAGFNPLQPTVISCLLYIQCLANTLLSVRSVKNYISGARTYIIGAGGHPAAFSSPLVATLLRGVTRLSGHVEIPAPPLSRRGLLGLCDDLGSLGPDGLVARAAVLFGVSTLLRQSNFLPTSSPGSGDHLVLRGDVRLGPDGAWVTVTSTKTRSRQAPPIDIRILRAPSSPYCPVLALRRAAALAPAGRGAPLFILPSTGRPLTPSLLTGVMRAALRRRRSPVADRVTVHSLRRTGAHLASNYGATQADVMTHGTWTSAAVRRYLPTELHSAAPAALAAVWPESR